MKKLLSLIITVGIFVNTGFSRTNDETLDKLLNITLTDGKIDARDVELLFPDLVSTSYRSSKSLGTKNQEQTIELKTVNNEKLVMLIINTIKNQPALTVTNTNSLLASIKGNLIRFEEKVLLDTKTIFDKSVHPKSAPKMITSEEKSFSVETNMAAFVRNFPELTFKELQLESRSKQTPIISETLKIDFPKVAAVLLQELKTEIKQNSVAAQ